MYKKKVRGTKLKTLFVTSEVFPFNKTGGLGDVCAWLPLSLKKAGVDIRYLLPAFPSVLQAFTELTLVHKFEKQFKSNEINVYRGTIKGNPIKFYLVEAANLFLRSGNPYSDVCGNPWGDNHIRYAAFSWVAAQFSELNIDNWTPDVIHINDWMTSLTPAYMEVLKRKNLKIKTSSVLTIHNLAFQGLYPFSVYEDLNLPNYMFNENGVEFYRQISFLKAGISFADKITAVSPTYAAEIQTNEFGCGLQESLIKRKDSVTGILNGVDYNVWNPATDKLIKIKYTKETLANKKLNKEYLQEQVSILKSSKIPLFGVCSRLTEQKGIDILIESIPAIMMNNIQLIVMGTDQGNYMPRLKNIAKQYPDQFAVLDFDEKFSHQLIAGCDVLINPSRFEPCGLTQMFAMKYGTIPFARRTGGLDDTIIDANFQNTIVNNVATGFLFENYSVHDFIYGINRILNTYKNEKKIWENIKKQAMNQNFSWDKSASEYIDLYNTQLHL